MRYLVLMAAYRLQDEAVELAQHACAWHDATEAGRLGTNEAARRWPESEGWRGHTVTTLRDAEHATCFSPFPMFAAIEAAARVGSRIAETMRQIAPINSASAARAGVAIRGTPAIKANRAPEDLGSVG